MNDRLFFSIFMELLLSIENVYTNVMSINYQSKMSQKKKKNLKPKLKSIFIANYSNSVSQVAIEEKC